MSSVNILNLPSEILTKILSYMGKTENFPITCKLFYEIVKKDRVIKLEKTKYVKILNGKKDFHMISANDKLIIIITSHSGKKIILIEKNSVIYRSKINISLYTIKFISNVIGNNIIIIVYCGGWLSPPNYSNTLNDFEVVLSQILNVNFPEYNYKIIYCHYGKSSDDDMNIWCINNYWYLELPEYSKILYVDDKYIYFSNWYSIHLYNHITHEEAKIIKPDWLSNLSSDRFTYKSHATEFECKKNITTDVKISLLKILCLNPVVINKVKLLFNDENLYLNKFLISDKYLIINYSSTFKSFIIAFNLYSSNRSIISSDVYEECYTQAWCIDGDNLYVSRYNNVLNIQSLYRMKLG